MKGLAEFLGRRKRRSTLAPVENCQSLDFQYANETAASIPMWLEPWAKEFWLEPGSSLRMRVFYTHLDAIELAQTSELFSIDLWRGCRAQIFIDGEDCTQGSMSLPAIG